jgi:LmbE family N-acetylglucosaminyl deacetylase
MKLLAIFAHPDDESFGPAGTLAKYAAAGHELGLVTLTRGEAGSLGISKQLGPGLLAELRSQELRCAAKILGISYLHIHQLPDKKLSELPDETGISIIEKEIEQFSPGIIITYDKEGITGHPDHKTVSRWVLETVDKIKATPVLLWFGVTRQQVAHLEDRQMFALNPEDITHRIDVRDVLQKKIDAIHCHKTQDELWKRIEKSSDDFESFSQWEHFMQVRPLPTETSIRNELF